MERAGIVAEPASPLECWLAWAVEHARRLDLLTDLGWAPGRESTQGSTVVGAGTEPRL
jgi:hypothetical protein